MLNRKVLVVIAIPMIEIIVENMLSSKHPFLGKHPVMIA